MIKLAIILLVFQINIFASEVIVNCPPSSSCEEYRELIKNQLSDIKLFKDQINYIRSLPQSKHLKTFSYRILGKKTTIDIAFNKKISFLDIESKKNAEIYKNLVGLKEGNYYNKDTLNSSRKRIIDQLIKEGHVNPRVEVLEEESEDFIGLTLRLLSDGVLKIAKVNTNKAVLDLPEFVKMKFNSFVGTAYNKSKVLIDLEGLEKELIELGYFYNKIILNDTIMNGDRQVHLNVKVELGERYNLIVRGAEKIDAEDIVFHLRQEFKLGNFKLNEKEISDIVNNFYEERNLFNTTVKLRKVTGSYRNGVPVNNLFVEINEGKKLKFKKLIFKGNKLVNLSQLERLFYNNASVLINRGYFDKKYIDVFLEKARNFYFENGYVLSEITKRIDFEKDKVEVVFIISEGRQCIIRNINITGLDDNTKNILLNSMINKKDKPLNIIRLEGDIKKSIERVKEEGYYFATLKNLKSEQILKYTANFTIVDLNLNFKSGKKLRFKRMSVFGLKKTKSKTIYRENRFKENELLSTSKLKKLNSKINSLGLFTKVVLRPVVMNRFRNDEYYETDIQVFVTEKNSGSGVVAPGYRTDLGAKLSFGLLYRNLFGLNHTASVKSQFNRRFSLGSLDARRKANNHHRIEALLNLSYNWPHFLDYFDFDVTSSFQRKRAFSYDADILRIAPRLSKEFNEYFSSSLRYQLEDIRQTDATNEKDDARFRVGSLTPSLTLDFRDSPVLPKDGSYFNLSWEFGNPYLGSQRGKDFEINYSKIVSRNRFYFPFYNKIFVFAASYSIGYQVNHADEVKLNSDGSRIINSDNTYQTKGYIPSIKVFRLDGQDSVRGFSSSEINRLNNGVAISDTRVQNTAYFENLKLEQRYYVSDSFGLGLFFDAGRIFVNHFQPLSLRSSVGLSFKLLTPVGSLDLDYGVKTERKRLNDGGREGFGRLHLTIGLF